MPRHLITGAGSGIGESLADRLTERGDALLLLARSEERAGQIAERYPDAEVLVADLARPDTLAGLGARIEGELDSLIHVAGVVDLGPVAELDLATWQRHLDVNLTAPAVLTAELLPALRRSRGTVVFVNSTSGISANPNWAAYAASKFALRGFADVVRGEEAEHGVRVTSVFPSRTATPMQQAVHEQEGRDYDASAWIAADSVAGTILHVLDLEPDATVPEVVLRTGPR